MKGLRLLLFAAALSAAAAGFSVRAVEAERCADAVRRNVSLVLEAPLSREGAQALFSPESGTGENSAGFAVWGELEGQRITDPDLGRSVQADVLAFCGSPELVFAQAGLSEDDREGCLIGEKTAWELFGSTGVAGDEIRMGDGVRTIRAVIHQPECGVVVAGDTRDITGGGEAPFYNRITVESRETAAGEAFLASHGLDGMLLRFDYLRSPDWLGELVPGKWSDFSGWKENCKRKKEDFALLARIRKNSVELYYVGQCLTCLWNAGLETACVLIAVAYAFRAWGNVAGNRPFYGKPVNLTPGRRKVFPDEKNS